MDLTEIIRNVRILIIDDDEASAFGLERILAQDGYAVCITITDPTQAVERFRQLIPDLVLLDLHMEPISGIEVLEQIKALVPERSRPPVLVLTADTTPEAKRDALAAGATDFLAKPLDSAEVLLRIRNLLRAHALYQQCQVYSRGLERLVEKRAGDLQRQARELEQTVAELQRTQQQVIQQERLRALGTMASGIAHDLNNGLSLILGFGDMLLRATAKFPSGTKERRYLEAMVTAGQDNALMVKRLREFYRPCASKENRQPVDLNEIVEETIALTAPRWQAETEAAGVTIRMERDRRKIPLIAGAPAELREVLTNLIFNAVDAMPRGGRILFRTREERGRVRLEVTDTGTGMTEETRRSCLEPFYTTKGERGSGLGLAVSYGIIRRHGGTIEIDTKLGEGTTFAICLPVLDTTTFTPVVVGPGKMPRSLRVLVVDDHPEIREIVSAYLAEDRHIVETAANASEALEKFYASPFDLVITDRAMPEMNGDQLAVAIKEIRPREPVILLTGFADLMNETGQRAENVDLVVSKPARLDDLRRAIIEVMRENQERV
jgi:signal transduction histidine kinase